MSANNNSENTNSLSSLGSPFLYRTPAGWIKTELFNSSSTKPEVSGGAYCANAPGAERDVLVLGKRRKKDEHWFYKLAIVAKGKTSREIKDQFAAKALCFLTYNLVCFSSWDMKESCASPIIRSYDIEKNEVGPILSIPSEIRRQLQKEYGGMYMNFCTLVPFLYENQPYLFAYSEEGLLCIWKVTCSVPDQKGSARYKVKTQHRKGRVAEGGSLIAWTVVPTSQGEEPNSLLFEENTRLLGACLGSSLDVIYAIDRHWRLWRWNWNTLSISFQALGRILQNITPLVGANSKPGSEKYLEQLGDEASRLGSGVLDQLAEEDNYLDSLWDVKLKSLKMHATETCVIFGPTTSIIDDESRLDPLATPSQDSLWPPKWPKYDWIVQFNVINRSVVSVVQGWFPTRGPKGTILALTDKESDISITKKKSKTKRGLLLLRETDMCILADSRSFNDRAAPVKEIISTSSPCLGMNLRPLTYPSRTLSKKCSSSLELEKEDNNSWISTFFKAKNANNKATRSQTGFSIALHDGCGQYCMLDIMDS